MDIIEVCAEALFKQGVKDVVVLASEGVFETRLYDRYFQAKRIEVQYPLLLMKEIRYYIESVKQNTITEETLQRFFKLLAGFSSNDVILGCTELPVVYEQVLRKYGKTPARGVHDPLEYVIQKLQRELK